LFEFNDGRDLSMDDILNPLLGFSYVTKVLVGLEELALLVHPVAPTKSESIAIALSILIASTL
jgi:hypothetical protein